MIPAEVKGNPDLWNNFIMFKNWLIVVKVGLVLVAYNDTATDQLEINVTLKKTRSYLLPVWETEDTNPYFFSPHKTNHTHHYILVPMKSAHSCLIPMK